ncbi:unnamed protein product [Cochlearia groenlandica]
MVKITKFVTSHPLCFILVTVILAVIFGGIPIMIWRNTTANITNGVALVTQDHWSSLVFHIQNIGELTYPKINQSKIGLARVIDSYLTNNITYFTEIQTKIVPLLFQAYVTIPQVAQVSYISKNGLLFSYITESNTCLAVFANSSSGGNYTWYVQTVDKLTGHLNGNATKSQPSDLIHTNWFQAARVNDSTAFMGTGLRGGDNETMFQNVGSLSSKKGVVSLGFRVKTLTDVLNRLNLQGGKLYVWTKEGKTVFVSEGSLNASSFISNCSICFGLESNLARSKCIPRNCGPRGCRVEIERSKFQAFSSVLEVSGLVMRYTLMFPIKEGPIIKYSGMIMLIAAMILGVLSPIVSVVFIRQTSIKVMHMLAKLITQREATQQAERKSMNKSQAFARASHDIRGSLAGITGLIDLCRKEVKPGSELDTSLKQVNVCIQDLVELLNSVLDMSKIESGKMQLDEEEFNLTKLVEDVTDIFHSVAMSKGVDVILDVQDGSIFKLSNLRGDSGKLKQILNNLVSNAVKFTVEGHISIRAWAQRPGSISSAAMATDPKGVGKFSNCLFCKNKDKSSTNYEIEISNSIRNNANTMEIVFQVEDTGIGIPLEMRKSVFENYVQVRETAQGQQGTGLGLGIVQSLVRLMGGEIRIVDKPMGEKGTCFQFNVLMKTSEATMMGHDIESGGDYISTPNLSLTINTSLGKNMNLRNLSPRFNYYFLNSSPKQVGSRVVLLLKDEGRRRVTEKYIKSLGIKVTMVEKWEHLSQALKSLSMERGETSLRNELSSPSRSRDSPLIGMDAIDSRSQVPKKKSNSFNAFVLLVIDAKDAKAGPLTELYDIVEQFRRGLQQNICCKVVWLNNPSARGCERGDLSFSKPLHGSRLNRVLKMLPEFGGTESKEASIETSPQHQRFDIQEEVETSRYKKKLDKSIMSPRASDIERLAEEEQVTCKPKEDEKLLKGKRVLVVDDNPNCLIAKRKLMHMGVSDSEFKECNSGKEAIRLINEWFTQRDETSTSRTFPFDYIFMDCEMPEMDGYDTTREIRKIERQYGVHIPIIAVSGHDSGSKEANATIEAGMDAYSEKNMMQLVNIIRDIESKMSSN